ncbi:amidase [Limnohabitans sp. Rim8]|uniref:amidase n=1 Tax=Limnohabitans sp. Rim8 TaxID=1100718 RepID=UPI0025CC3931|nr:amidase [Limnohabitans sp. Rim8]
MAAEHDFLFFPLAKQAELLHTKQLSPVELVEASIRRIEQTDKTLCAWISVGADQAIAAARQTEGDILKGHIRGPLHGIPFGVKDQMHALGFKTTMGTRVLDEHEMQPPFTTTAIDRLTTAGAIFLGKQNLHEFGKGGTLNFPYGQPKNPWDIAYNASSTSTGSGIATAAGQCSFSLGEDTGGSIRGPASCNGVCGMRPTHGRVSRHGGVMAAYTSDTIGPLARTVLDLASVLQVIAGHDPNDPLCSTRPVPNYRAELHNAFEGLKGMKLAVVKEIARFDGVHTEVSKAFERAVDQLRDLGAEIHEVSLPWAKWAVPLQMLTADADVAAWFQGNYLKDRYERFDQGTRTRLIASSLIPASVYSRAMRARRLVRQQVLDAFNHFDALLTPTNITPPKKIEDSQERVDSPEDMVPRLIQRRISLYPFSLSNVPAMSIPMGFSENGLPLALQIAARPFGESTVFRVGHAYQMATHWHEQHPDLKRIIS